MVRHLWWNEIDSAFQNILETSTGRGFIPVTRANTTLANILYLFHPPSQLQYKYLDAQNRKYKSSKQRTCSRPYPLRSGRRPLTEPNTNLAFSRPLPPRPYRMPNSQPIVDMFSVLHHALAYPNTTIRGMPREALSPLLHQPFNPPLFEKSRGRSHTISSCKHLSPSLSFHLRLSLNTSISPHRPCGAPPPNVLKISCKLGVPP